MMNIFLMSLCFLAPADSLRMMASQEFPLDVSSSKTFDFNAELPKDFAKVSQELEKATTANEALESLFKRSGSTATMSDTFRKAASSVPLSSQENGVLVFIPGATNSRIPLIKKQIAWMKRQTVPI